MLLYDKFKNTKGSDKACLQTLKCKLETTRPYLNTPIFPKFTKNIPKLRNSTTTPIIEREGCFPKRELWAKLHSKDNEIKKLKL